MAEQPANHGLEKFQWLMAILRIKAVLIILLAKPHGIDIPGMIHKPVTDITISTAMVCVIKHLEHPVMLDDPVGFFCDKRA